MSDRRGTSLLAEVDAVEAREQLIERIRRGDEPAFDRLFRLCYQPLVRFARRYLDSHPDAEEAVIDALVHLWDLGDTWSVRGPLSLHLLSVVRNRALNARKAAAVVSRRYTRVELEERDHGLRLAGAPEANAEASALSIQARRIFDALPPRSREIFLMLRRDAMSVREVAAVLGVAPSTVQTQITRVVAAFRRGLSLGD